jgi:hypothetical protein
LVKRRAIVWFRRLVERLFGRLVAEEDFTVDLWDAAFRTRVVSSVGVRSAIERRCRGANGEVWMVDGVL